MHRFRLPDLEGSGLEGLHKTSDLRGIYLNFPHKKIKIKTHFGNIVMGRKCLIYLKMLFYVNIVTK